MKHNRTSKKLDRPTRCPYCGAPVQIRPASEIYGDSSLTGKMYVCSRYPDCNTYVGTHAGTLVPLGQMANGDLRHLRILAHREFDSMWRTGVMSRGTAYRWLADLFGLRQCDAHIGRFGEHQCKALIDKCKELKTFRAKVSA